MEGGHLFQVRGMLGGWLRGHRYWLNILETVGSVGQVHSFPHKLVAMARL